MEYEDEGEEERDEAPRPGWSEKRRLKVKRILKKARNLQRCRIKSRKGLGKRRYK